MINIILALDNALPIANCRFQNRLSERPIATIPDLCITKSSAAHLDA